MAFDNFDWKRVNLPLDQERIWSVSTGCLRISTGLEGWLFCRTLPAAARTHLASAIVNYQYQAKNLPCHIRARSLDHLRSAFNPDSKISYDVYSKR
jgi:DNA replication protein DnaC